ncbi:MAG: NUDIX domain-containing protein [Tenericutes bacterium]|nr:NUDIX domain-containing protein [Mycoplasmatota bacterium]
MEKNKMPGVGLGVMVLDIYGRVLLILRNSDASLAKSDMHLEGTWTLPAGKINYGESLITAAKRKVKEEVNLQIDGIKVISVADDINTYAHFLTVGVIADSYSGEINLGNTKEHVDYKFFDLDNMPSNLCEPSKKIIKNYRNNRIYEGE